MSYIIAAILISLAVGLTIAMFVTRNSMLGFPSGIFWAIAGGYAYQQSSATWDLQYLIFFAAMGMVIFSIFAAFALRKRDLSGPDADRGQFIDEGGGGSRSSRGPCRVKMQYADDEGETGPRPSWGDIDHLPMDATEDPVPSRHARAREQRAREHEERRKDRTAARRHGFGG